MHGALHEGVSELHREAEVLQGAGALPAVQDNVTDAGRPAAAAIVVREGPGTTVTTRRRAGGRDVPRESFYRPGSGPGRSFGGALKGLTCCLSRATLLA